MRNPFSNASRMISIHPPCGGRDGRQPPIYQPCPISIHPPCGGRDTSFHHHLPLPLQFQSTRPVGGGTGGSTGSSEQHHISIHPPCGGRDPSASSNRYAVTCISIHPPCGGRDGRKSSGQTVHGNISIHPPCGGRDIPRPLTSRAATDFNPPALWGAGRPTLRPWPRRSRHFNPPALWGAGPPALCRGRGGITFQSTRPVGGGTLTRGRKSLGNYFNPPALWGAGHSCTWSGRKRRSISIHPPCGGRDSSFVVGAPVIPRFQSTRPVGGGTIPDFSRYYHINISIHPPCGGRDAVPPQGQTGRNGISIHPPCGGRDWPHGRNQ